MVLKVYYKKQGQLLNRLVDGFDDDIKENLQYLGLTQMRRTVGADHDSPIIVIAK